MTTDLSTQETGRLDSVLHWAVDACRFCRRDHETMRPM